ncbi:PTS sugar transporter subunit IIC [Liquorilactobacillus satsumensis]|uniref:PTS transporter subunit IIC n=1 Tax=Liquorilactobacillus satsumensis TaxID=259059 RepID=UPI0021C4A378|nr:PTS sugar transporter subunit IIC [Liquorilactobacillus satsumensis]MCP9313295.1 PTS sugar transporter subunit IIC [Liquorilactobacillus satsumensis]MCP9360455.1 PTS sugar transporter subunit IIC [Liquorilactobacillus satsumensis]
MIKKVTGQEYSMNVLNGISLGVVVALVPAALVGQLMQALKGILPRAMQIVMMTTFAMSLLPVIAGLCVAIQFKLNPIQISAVGIAAMVGSGVMQQVNRSFILKGTGDIINTGLTIAFAVWLALFLGDRFKNYTILLLPLLVIVIAGGAGLLVLPYVKLVATTIGALIAHLTTLQPLLMGLLMGICFGILVVSPISSVGIATAIGLAGIGSGSANLGITAASFMLAVYGSTANNFGTTIAHFIGSPKIQMGNLLQKPALFFPLSINAGIMGFVGAIFGIKGNPMSAGFGFSGLIGPSAAYQQMPHSGVNLGLLVLLFVVLPVLLAYLSRYLFVERLKWFRADDLLLQI